MPDEQTDDKKITVAGEKYPFPALVSFDMDEAEILYESCGMTLEDFASANMENPEDREAIARRLAQPGFLRAILHVAYRRGNPGASKKEIHAIVGKEKNADALLEYINALVDEDDAGPPVSQPSETLTEPTKPVSQSDGSGTDSTTGSDAPEETPAATGTTESRTSHISAVAN